ncbi:uncharacterized protein LOC34618496 [Cyclospora cayetanensis]|uniref:Uncharacterized protein LOC34618496 n=1 Tax=Cyclospora cayetanensis TaxID=88456 RepID=A0A6P6RYR4_9EIME|nr:uncharacterized protein LOC34618496 [Cyclospora cayetanensis]
MGDRAEIVSRSPIARPPLRPFEVFVTRRVPLVVYFKRCQNLLRGPYGAVRIRGAGSCVETAIYLAQDVVAAFGGQVSYNCTVTKPQQQAAPLREQAAATAPPPGAPTTQLEEASGATFEQKAAAVFAAAAARLAAIEGGDAALVAISAETTTVQAYDEVLSLENVLAGPKDGALEAAGIQLDLNSFVQQRNISAIVIELRRLSPPLAGCKSY